MWYYPLWWLNKLHHKHRWTVESLMSCLLYIVPLIRKGNPNIVAEFEEYPHGIYSILPPFLNNCRGFGATEGVLHCIPVLYYCTVLPGPYYKKSITRRLKLFGENSSELRWTVTSMTTYTYTLWAGTSSMIPRVAKDSSKIRSCLCPVGTWLRPKRIDFWAPPESYTPTNLIRKEHSDHHGQPTIICTT